MSQSQFCTPVHTGIGENAFARAELDAFMRTLLDGAVPMAEAVAPMVDIPMAAKKTCCSAAEIVRLVLGRKLARVGRLEGVEGYMSVLVDFEEIRRLVRGPALDGLTAQMVQRELRTTHKVVKALIAAGKLKTERFVNPLNRCPVDLVSRADFDAFRAEFISLSELSEFLGRHRLIVQAMMAERGIEPALGRKPFGAAFYRRAEVAT